MAYWPKAQFFSQPCSSVWFSGFQKQLSISTVPFRSTQITVLAVKKAPKNDCIVEKVVFGKVIALFVGSPPSLAHTAENI